MGHGRVGHLAKGEGATLLGHLRFLGKRNGLRTCLVQTFERTGPHLGRDGPTQGPSWGYLKVFFSETLPIFGDKRPRNGSKKGEMAPRTGTGYPHIGPFMVR
jgi:hypothetical protein